MQEVMAATGSIVEEVQLALTPVFLLTAIAGFLSILVTRLARASDGLRQENLSPQHEKALTRRVRTLYWAMGSVCIGAITVCTIVIMIFISDFIVPNLSVLITVCFIFSLVCIIASVLLLLFEIGIMALHPNRQALD